MFRGFATLSFDIGNTSSFSVGCATATFAGAATTDRLMVTPVSIPAPFVMSSAQVSAANTIQLCALNSGFGASNPAAFNVSVAVYIP